MYERSAIVLERYFNNICKFDKKINLKTIYKDYKEITEEIRNYQTIIQEEDTIICEFDEAANEIRTIQQEQKKLYKNNIKLEEERNQLFDNLDESASNIEKRLLKIEENLDKNNKRLIVLREEFVKAITKFNEKQTERNKYSRRRREEEVCHLQLMEKAERDLKAIEISDIKALKEFINSDTEEEKEEIIDIMVNNGRDERVPFDKNVIENAAKYRNQIAKKEAECYVTVYERIRKLLIEINNDDVKLEKNNKTLRDVSVKLAFLKAEKMYIVSFLDNERMTAINGVKAHKTLMLDACEKFELDIQQFKNLYELILKEISGKASKKAYMELYNKEYLKNIEEKEKNFEKEINNINIKTGTIINSNYWRTEEIKNIYEVFQKEVSEKFNKDLSEFKLEIAEEIEENNQELVESEESDDIFEKNTLNDVIFGDQEEYDDDEYYDDDYDEEEYEEEYDSDNDEYDDSDEYDEDYDDEDEYEDEEDYDEYEEDDDENDNEDEEIAEDIKEKTSQTNEVILDSIEKNKKGIFNKIFKDKRK